MFKWDHFDRCREDPTNIPNQSPSGCLGWGRWRLLPSGAKQLSNSDLLASLIIIYRDRHLIQRALTIFVSCVSFLVRLVRAENVYEMQRLSLVQLQTKKKCVKLEVEAFNYEQQIKIFLVKFQFY